jgi:hypothetical protein
LNGSRFGFDHLISEEIAAEIMTFQGYKLKDLLHPRFQSFEHSLEKRWISNDRLHHISFSDDEIQVYHNDHLLYAHPFKIKEILNAKLVNSEVYALILSNRDVLSMLRLNNDSITELYSIKGPSKILHSFIDPLGLMIVSALPFEILTNSTGQLPVQDEQRDSKLNYSWNQTDNDVSIHLTLPLLENLQKNQIYCLFTRQMIRIRIQGRDFLHEDLFDEIDYTESIWNLNHDSSVLSLYLSKLNKKMRWIHVFKQDDHVYENMDSSTMQEYLDSMEKFTEPDLKSSEMSSSFMAFTEKPELIDFEGDSVTISAFSHKGDRSVLWKDAYYKWIGPCFSEFHDDSFCVSSDVDGVVFKASFQMDGSVNLTQIQEFPGFGYIQASKRDRLFIGYALNYALVVEPLRVYLYRKPEKNSSQSDQYICELDRPVKRVFECDRLLVLETERGQLTLSLP